MSEPFELTNEPPPPEPWQGEKPEPTRQKVLFSGMECLPGQLDLFDTDQVAPSGEQS